MKTKELEFFGISRQNKSEWKKKNNKKYNIVILLEKLDFEETKKTIENIKLNQNIYFKIIIS